MKTLSTGGPAASHTGAPERPAEPAAAAAAVEPLAPPRQAAGDAVVLSLPAGELQERPARGPLESLAAWELKELKEAERKAQEDAAAREVARAGEAPAHPAADRVADTTQMLPYVSGFLTFNSLAGLLRTNGSTGQGALAKAFSRLLRSLKRRPARRKRR